MRTCTISSKKNKNLRIKNDPEMYCSQGATLQTSTTIEVAQI